jgi:hypothetical protein
VALARASEQGGVPRWALDNEVEVDREGVVEGGCRWSRAGASGRRMAMTNMWCDGGGSVVGGGGVAVAAPLGVTRLCLGKRECGGAGPGSGHVRGSVP